MRRGCRRIVKGYVRVALGLYRDMQGLHEVYVGICGGCMRVYLFMVPPKRALYVAPACRSELYVATMPGMTSNQVS